MIKIKTIETTVDGIVRVDVIYANLDTFTILVDMEQRLYKPCRVFFIMGAYGGDVIVTYDVNNMDEAKRIFGDCEV